MRYTKTLMMAGLLLMGGACRTDTLRATYPEDPRPGQGIAAGELAVQVDKASKTLTLRNTTEFVVGYLIVEKDIATIALFPPCGANCTKLVQGQSKTINFSEIVGYTPAAREARVMWWTYAPGTNGQAQGGVNTVVVRLD
jgi:hypothetical protein